MFGIDDIGLILGAAKMVPKAWELVAGLFGKETPKTVIEAGKLPSKVSNPTAVTTRHRWSALGLPKASPRLRLLSHVIQIGHLDTFSIRRTTRMVPDTHF